MSEIQGYWAAVRVNSFLELGSWVPPLFPALVVDGDGCAVIEGWVSLIFYSFKATHILTLYTYNSSLAVPVKSKMASRWTENGRWVWNCGLEENRILETLNKQFLKHPLNFLRHLWSCLKTIYMNCFKLSLKLLWNTLEAPSKHPPIFFETTLKLSWNTLEAYLNHP